MNIIEIILVSFGLSMDASAVSMTNGLTNKTIGIKEALKIATYFGFFQALMPLIGYFLGISFKKEIEALDHYIALILLGLIGIKMIVEAFKKEDKVEEEKILTHKKIFIQAIATSIDALVMGVTFIALNINIYLAVSIIGICTFSCSLISVYLGKKFGSILESKAEIIGGAILLLIGIKIFIEHTFEL